MRDYSGKKPHTYNNISSTISMDTQKSKYPCPHSISFDSVDSTNGGGPDDPWSLPGDRSRPHWRSDENVSRNPQQGGPDGSSSFGRHSPLYRSGSQGLTKVLQSSQNSLNRYKREGSKRFERIRRTLTFGAHDNRQYQHSPRVTRKARQQHNSPHRSLSEMHFEEESEA